MNFVICKRNRLQTYLLTNLIINLTYAEFVKSLN